MLSSVQLDRDHNRNHNTGLSANAMPVSGDLLGELNVSSGLRPASRAFLQDLPILPYRSQILETVYSNPITIISAETGSGKTTEVPKFFFEEGHRVVVTQPRKTAVWKVSEWVAERVGTPLGHDVGFRTSEERRDCRDTNLLFCTDGLQLVRELFGHAGDRDILFLDEVHEWNINMETLLAWARREALEKSSFRLVLMSATLEAEALAEWCGGAPTIAVPGRLFPIEERAPLETPAHDIKRLIAEGHRGILMFEPGKPEIEQAIEDLRLAGVDAELLPLHARLSMAEQQPCFMEHARPKVVVSTNVARTSLTIPGISAVICSGWERRAEVHNGIQGLYYGVVSRADREQNKGRAGRTMPGVFIDRSPIPLELRPAYVVPEIMRTNLEHCYLRLAKADFRMEQLDFFHQPPREDIGRARDSLETLKCLDRNGRVTSIGHKAAVLPISVRGACMINQAERLEARHPGIVQDVVAMAAILESEGIVMKGKKDWKRFCPDEKDSDLIAQALVFKAVEQTPVEDLLQLHISPKLLERARAIRANVLRRLKLDPGELLEQINNDQYREAVFQCILAGMVEHLYIRKDMRLVKGSTSRTLSQHSVVQEARLLVGRPYDIEVRRSNGETRIVPLVLMASRIEPHWLKQHAPWALGQIPEKMRTDTAEPQPEQRKRATYTHLDPARARRRSRG